MDSKIFLLYTALIFWVFVLCVCVAMLRRAVKKERALQLVTLDPHGPNEMRCNGTLSNVPEFLQVSCKGLMRRELLRKRLWCAVAKWCMAKQCIAYMRCG
jgi:hypothetical protein